MYSRVYCILSFSEVLFLSMSHFTAWNCFDFIFLSAIIMLYGWLRKGVSTAIIKNLRSKKARMEHIMNSSISHRWVSSK